MLQQRFFYFVAQAATQSLYAWPRVLALGIALSHLLALLFVFATPDVRGTIAKTSINPESGFAYLTPLEIHSSRFYIVQVDTSDFPLRSRLVLLEDQRPLGPAHSLHNDVREYGSGRYSHWNGTLIWSTSDNSDPRLNGRIYSFQLSTVVSTSIQVALSVLLLSVDLLFLSLHRRLIARILRDIGSQFFVWIGLTILSAAAIFAFILRGPFRISNGELASDASLVIQSFCYSVFGCVLAIMVWAAGTGVSRLWRSPASRFSSVLIVAYPVSLVVVAGLVSIALVVPRGAVVSCVLYIACIIPIVLWRPHKDELRAAAKAGFGILPFAIGFGSWLAILWHGPTKTLVGTPSGDLTFYVGLLWSLAHKAYPLLNLGYEAGQPYPYFNTLFSAIGATFSDLRGFDPFLFVLGCGGACYVFLSTFMLHLYLSNQRLCSTNVLSATLIVFATLAAARYPYWVAESIPIVFTPALAISVLWMANRASDERAWSALALVSALVGSALSKVVTAAVLVPLAASGLWYSWRSFSQLARLACLTVAAVFFLYCSILLFRFLPTYLNSNPLGPESLSHGQWWFRSRDIGALLLIICSWYVAEAPIALALSVGLITFLTFHFLFQVNFVSSTILLGLLAASNARVSIAARCLTLLAVSLTLPAALLSDPAGVSTGLAWILCLGGGTVVAIMTAVRVENRLPLVSFSQIACLATFVSGVAGLGLVGIGRGVLIANSGWDWSAPHLTPQLKDIWEAVRRLTPYDALIFTDQVDESIGILGGWNTYAYAGQRQLYLSSYFTAFDLRFDHPRLVAVISANRSVLDGRDPKAIPIRKVYNSFFAVVALERQIPAAWIKIYNNSQYALYKVSD